MKNSFLYTVVFTFVLCFLFVLILSFANIVTIDKIEENVRIEKQIAILQSLGVKNIDAIAQIEEQFQKVQEVEFNGETYYKMATGDVPAYAFAFSGPGLWGTISGYIAIEEGAKKIKGFSITDQNETPGLGARISERWFLDQFVSESIINNNVVVLKGGTGDTNKENGSIDGITGATRTSEGIQAIITNAIKQFKESVGE